MRPVGQAMLAVVDHGTPKSVLENNDINAIGARRLQRSGSSRAGLARRRTRALSSRILDAKTTRSSRF
jgi:hypothetical protein